MSAELQTVERWAKRLGYIGRPLTLTLPEWSVVIIGDVVTVFRGILDKTRQWDLDPITALLWAACVESGAVVDCGPCPACSHLDAMARVGTGKPCETCSILVEFEPGKHRREPTGRVSKPLARLVCEAAPRKMAPLERYGDRPVIKGIVQPDPRAREALTVASDRLLADGAPIGEWIAAWLRGECWYCDGGGEFHLVDGLWITRRELGPEDVVDGTGDCDKRSGHGVLLGAHVDAMASALEPGSDRTLAR